MNEKKELAKVEPSYSQRFTNAVVKEFGQEVGKMELTLYQQRLAQHLFIAIDTQLKALEIKRTGEGLPIAWPNINMNKLAIDSVHRVELGLDALIPNHIHPIPYFNKKAGKYDLDLRIGYAGKDCYRRKMAIETPVDIIYELVYATDKFEPIKKGLDSEIDTYKFEIANPFERGKVVGGFGYIMYEDTRLNQLVIVTNADFEKSKKAAKTDTFWENHPTEMKFKTLVIKVTNKLPVDPEKVNASFMAVEVDDAEAQAERDIKENANKETIDVEPMEYEEVEPETTSIPPLGFHDIEPKESGEEIQKELKATGTKGPAF